MCWEGNPARHITGSSALQERQTMMELCALLHKPWHRIAIAVRTVDTASQHIPRLSSVLMTQGCCYLIVHAVCANSWRRKTSPRRSLGGPKIMVILRLDLIRYRLGKTPQCQIACRSEEVVGGGGECMKSVMSET